MNGKTLKYDFSNEEANYLFQALNRVQIVGVAQAQALVAMIQKLQSPANASELEKDQLEALKAKYEKPERVDKKVN